VEPFGSAGGFSSTLSQETMMKTPVFISIVAAAMLATAATASYAQDKGSSGWNGGAKDQPSQSSGNGQPAAPSPATTGQKVEIHDAAEAKDQPTIATGADLNGPAAQLAPSKTPE
jgi:hypothetical protein